MAVTASTSTPSTPAHPGHTLSLHGGLSLQLLLNPIGSGKLWLGGATVSKKPSTVIYNFVFRREVREEPGGFWPGWRLWGSQ